QIIMAYQPSQQRYDKMIYRRCGKSGLKLPALSLGLWHNFGEIDDRENARKILRDAFDAGITHFDLANNNGPPPGSAETTFGTIMRDDFKSHRDELIISTKAGWTMWDGPNGDLASKKYLVARLDQRPKRSGRAEVDIDYHHRRDAESPLEETMAASDLIVRQGQALYAGRSSHSAEETSPAAAVLASMGTPCLIH